MPCPCVAGFAVGSIVRAAAATGRAGSRHENCAQWSPDGVGFSVSAHRPVGPAAGAIPALLPLENVSEGGCDAFQTVRRVGHLWKVGYDKFPSRCESLWTNSKLPVIAVVEVILSAISAAMRRYRPNVTVNPSASVRT